MLVHFGNVHLGLLQHYINGLLLEAEVCNWERRSASGVGHKGTGSPPEGRSGALSGKGFTEDQLAPGQGRGGRREERREERRKGVQEDGKEDS